MGNFFDKKFVKVGLGLLTGDYKEIVETVAKGLGAKSEDEIASIVEDAGKARDIINVIKGNAADTLTADREFQAKMAEIEMTKINNFMDNMIEYEGAAKDMPQFIQILRGLVRPTITWMCVIGTLICIGIGISNNIAINEMVPQVLAYMDYAVLGFWFGERSVTRVLDVYKNGRMAE